MKKNVALFALLLVFFLSSCTKSNAPVVFDLTDNFEIQGLYASWDSLENNTTMSCRCDGDYFRFKYVAQDTTPTFAEEYVDEMSSLYEDRVEIFFCPDRLMKCYYGAEMDPLGRILDYEGKFYRNFDFDWDFKTMKISGKWLENGYEVSGEVSLSELRELGVPTDGTPFYMGVFQADYHRDSTVNWYSRVKTDDVEADFHKPDVLFCVKINAN